MTDYYNGAALSGGWNLVPFTSSAFLQETTAPTTEQLARMGAGVVTNSGVVNQFANYLSGLGYNLQDPVNLENAYLCAALVYLMDTMKLIIGGKRDTDIQRGGVNLLKWRYNWLRRAYADVMKTTLFKKVRAFFHPRQPDGTSVGAEMTRKWMRSDEPYAPFPRAAYLRQIPSKMKVNGQILDLLKTAAWNDPAPGAYVHRKRGNLGMRDWMLRPPTARVLSPEKKAELKQKSQNKTRARIRAALAGDTALISGLRGTLDAQTKAYNDAYVAQAAQAQAARAQAAAAAAAAPPPPPPPADVAMTSDGGAGYFGGYALAY